MTKKVRPKNSDASSQTNSAQGFVRKHTLALLLIVEIAIGVLMLSSSLLGANRPAQPVSESAVGEVKFTVLPAMPHAESQGTGGVVSFEVVKK